MNTQCCQTWSILIFSTVTLKIRSNFLNLIYSLSSPNQGGQSGGQDDGVHGFPEPIKSFITFVILSKNSCGKGKNFCTRLCQSFSWVCCSFPDYLEQLTKKRKILRDWVHTSVVRGNLENCAEPRRNFYTVL